MLRLLPILALAPAEALAHAGQRGFVLLLPTEWWTLAGVAAVALTAAASAAAPPGLLAALFRPRLLLRRPALPGAQTLSLAAAALLWLLIAAGFFGSRDPLANPLPLTIWTLWWVGFTLATAVLGDLWAGVNPFAGPHALLRRRLGPAPLALPGWLDAWPAVALLLAFGWFELVSLAPEDPAVLARAVALYWLGTMAGLALFGRDWLARCEPFTVFFRLIAGLAPVWTDREGARVAMRCGLPGARLLAAAAPSPAAAALILLALSTVTFDGLKATFFWLALIGENPLEFTGRSAVTAQNTAGLIGAWVALGGAFALAVWIGARLSGGRFGAAFLRQAPALAPIALGYHFGHYLTVLLVNGQYALAAATDPLSQGMDLLGVGPVVVTTGFFFEEGSVRRIWLTQAGAVVGGHLIAVLMSHRAALALAPDPRAAALAQAPLAVLMTLYTLLGLWLLSAPVGA